MPITEAARLPRPSGVGPQDPVPHAVNNDLTFFFDVKKRGGGTYGYCAESVFYATIKAKLTDTDLEAKYHVSSEDPGSPFTVVGHIQDRMRFSAPAADWSLGLTPDTVYYFDVQIITPSGEVQTLIYDEIRPWQQVTKTVT